jgi:MFS family permease
LNLALLEWVSRHFLDWHLLWHGAIFQPNAHALAYSDVLVPQALLYALLRPMLGQAGAFNLIELIAWVVGLWSTHLLARRFCTSDAAACVASVGWNFSVVRLAHLEHPQLVFAGALVPLGALLLFRALERSSLACGALLGIVLAATTLAANYYGLMVVLGVATVAAVILIARRDLVDWRLCATIAVAFGVFAVVVLPFWLQYHSLERDPYFRREPIPFLSTRPHDLLSVPATAQRLSESPGLSVASNSETPIFPGLALGILAGVGLVALAVRRATNWAEILGVVTAAVLMLLLSGGGFGWFAGSVVYRAVAAVVPGFSGIRAAARFALFFELGVVVCAAAGLGFIRLGSHRAFVAIVLLSGVLVALESRSQVPVVALPGSSHGSDVNAALAQHPGGLTAELPILTETSGWVWGYVEAPRMFLAQRDGNPRVNGYSGFEPPGFERTASLLNTFPSTRAVRWLQDHHVVYVIVRRQVAGAFGEEKALLESLQPVLDDHAIDKLAQAGAPWLRETQDLGDAVLFVLRTTTAREPCPVSGPSCVS